MTVPLMELQGQWAALMPRAKQALLDVVDSGRYILGPQVEAFEGEATAMLGVAHGVGVANGTDALALALRAVGVERGDEVICPSYTFYATAEAIAAVGAVPVFADIRDDYDLDPAAVEAAVTPRTRAVVAVHLFGHVADLEALRAVCDRHGLALVEDAAQAFGAGQGVAQVGDVATFSFFPTKNLATFGDGGLITTPREDVADTCRTLRFHGSKDKQTFTQIGYNSRLDELHAAVLRVFLEGVGAWNEARRAAAVRYRELGLGEHATLPPDGGIYHLYMTRVADRARVVEACRAAGVACGVYYATPLHRQPVFADLPARDLPVTEACAREGLALPMFPTLSSEQQREVVAAVASARTPA
jgi:dTDP-4-amino-4,6-dideoxygalactose transaminase